MPGGRQENRLHDDLCGGVQCGPAHAARQARAYALGWSWIRENPAGFVAKTGRELLDMVQLQYGGAERLRAGYTQGDVPAPHLLGLLLDDTLYAFAAPLAVVGLLRRQCRPGKGLIAGWLAYNIAVGALIFAINRFRQPLLPFVFIYAACALAQWRSAWSGAWRRRLAYSVAVLLGLLILPSYLYWPPVLGRDNRSMVYETLLGFQGLREAAECRRIENMLGAGDVAGARALHDAADAREDLEGRDCLALVNARILEAEGKIDGPDGALAFLARSNPENDQQQSSRVLLTEGDLLRRLGHPEDAIGRLVAREVDAANDLPWAWNELPVPPPAARIDLGGGLDTGYIDGFYTRDYVDDTRKLETGYRWSGPHSVLRFTGAGTGAPQTLTLRVNPCLGCWPRRAVFTPTIGTTVLPAVELRDGWQEIAIALPPTPAGDDVIVRLDNPVFAPGPDTLAVNMRSQVRQPLRLLGTQVDWAELE